MTNSSDNGHGTGTPYLKPVEGGFLFETFNPWLFGPARRYILNEQQRQALIDVIKPRRPVLRIVLITTAITAYTCGVSLVWWALSPRESPNTRDLVGMAVTLLVPLYLFALVGIRYFLKRIEPIVSKATPTHARLTVSERYRAVGDAMSTKLLVACVAIWTFSALTNVVTILGRRTAQVAISEPRAYLPIFGLITSTAFALLAAWGLYRRLRAAR